MREKEFLPMLEKKFGITELNRLQKESLEKCKSSHDMLILGRTGSGKTLAFVLSMLKNLKAPSGRVQALILSPTRELALQTYDITRQLAEGYKTTVLYGSHKVEEEANTLRDTPDILVATPGRLLDHIRRGRVDLKPVRILIIDEYDKLLELGFEEEMIKIVKRMPNVSFTYLVSATEPEELPDYLGMDSPARIGNVGNEEGTASGKLRIHRVDIPEKDKLPYLPQLLGDIMPEGNEKTVVFVNYRESIGRIADYLSKEGINAGIYHGALDQHDRINAVEMFSNGSMPLLIATDLAARGLDFPDVKNIVHYHQAPSQEAYIHRNGRTARVDREGDVYILRGKDEILPEWIESCDEIPLSGKRLEKLAPEYVTLSVSAGKKEKLSKGDIVGFLVKKAGLPNDAVGKIFVSDHYSLAAVRRKDAKGILRKIENEKIKGEKRKFRLMQSI